MTMMEAKPVDPWLVLGDYDEYQEQYVQENVSYHDDVKEDEPRTDLPMDVIEAVERYPEAKREIIQAYDNLVEERYV